MIKYCIESVNFIFKSIDEIPALTREEIINNINGKTGDWIHDVEYGNENIFDSKEEALKQWNSKWKNSCYTIRSRSQVHHRVEGCASRLYCFKCNESGEFDEVLNTIDWAVEELR